VKNRLSRVLAAISMLTLSLVTTLSLAPTASAQTPSVTPGGEMKPVVMLTVNSYDELKQDINFLGSLAGQPELASTFEPFILGFTQGLDKAKPLGVLVQSDGMQFGGAVCLPVQNLKTFLANLQAFGVTSTELDNGLQQISANGQNLFGKEAAGWTFLSMMPQMLENLPADPAATFATLTDEYDLGIRASVQNIPEAYRQMAVDQMRKGMEAGMKKMPDEEEDEFQARQALATAQVQNLERMIKEVDEFTFGMAVDRKEQKSFFDIVYTAVAGTQLAEQLKTLGNPTTNYAGFFQPDATGMMMASSKINDADKDQTKQMFDAFRKQIESHIDKDSGLPTEEAKTIAKSAGNDIMDALLATIDAGKMDLGAVLNLTPEKFTLVAGGFIGDPAKLESGLKKLAEMHKENPEMPPVKWNAETHSGVTFHTVSVPTPANEKESLALFGETIDFALGVSKDSFYFAMGRDCLAAAKKVIDDSAASPGKEVAPVEMTVSVGQILTTVAAFEKEDQVLQSVVEALKTEAVGRDHVRIVAQAIENGLRTRFEIEEGVMRAIGVATMAQQMQAMGVQEQPAGAAQ
jgi:hypothetical protein